MRLDASRLPVIANAKDGGRRFDRHGISMEKTHNCSNCPIRARYDRAPRSLVGRLWRWHIGFCPGWRKYFASLDEPARAELRQKYGLH